mmetsp:Transcript_19068/g.30549  ORF Transcript_19068/g.30549 Transcript_19068/m.30549 type:complete len:765 (+) Transcript_19068:122-2416(+)
MARPTYLFGNGKSEGNAGMKSLLGVRGAHACEMANLGLPVSPGFCITSKFLQGEEGGSSSLSDTAKTSIKEAVGGLEGMVGRRFGNPADPLVLSVQGDLATSAPDFHGTIANIGLNDETVEVWTNVESPHFVWDSYRRLIHTFSKVVRRLNMEPFESALLEVKMKLDSQCQLGRRHADCHIPTHDLRNLVAQYKNFFEEQTGEPFPQEPEKQLWEAVHAASHSWDLSSSECRGVTVQSTVFGNHDFRSAVGVTFPSSDSAGASTDEDDDSFAPPIRGEWLTNAMFEDWRSHDRERLQLSEDASRDWAADKGIPETQREQEYLSLEEDMPSVFAQLLRCQDIVENHIADVKSFDFAVSQGRLWILQGHTARQPGAILAPQREMPHEADETMQASVDVVMPPEILTASIEEEFVTQQADLPEVCCADDADDTDVQFDSMSEYAECEEAHEESSCQPDPLPKRSNHHGSIRHGLLGSRLWQRWRKIGKQATGRAETKQLHDESQVQQRGDSGSILVLPAWQTGLAGGSAAVACRAVASGLQAVKPSILMQGHWCQGFRNLLAAGVTSSSARVFQTGAICCTLYTNLCNMTPADDSQNRFSPLWRLGCAGFAATAANTVTHATGAAQFTSILQKSPAALVPRPTAICGVSPMLAAVVPTMAMEMCTIDLVRNAAVERGYEVTPGLLFASGAAAGVATQMMLQPLQILKNHAFSSGTRPAADFSLIRPSLGSATQVCAAMGSACLRSSPVVATNSLVRVGLVTYFMSLR